jgi:hypothetical protein
MGLTTHDRRTVGKWLSMMGGLLVADRKVCSLCMAVVFVCCWTMATTDFVGCWQSIETLDLATIRLLYCYCSGQPIQYIVNNTIQ